MGGGPNRLSKTAHQELASTMGGIKSNIPSFVEVFVAPTKVHRWPRRSRVLIFDATETDLLLLFQKLSVPQPKKLECRF